MAAPAPLTKKVGPLPTWAWGAAAIVGLALFFVMRRSSSSASAPAAASGGQPTVATPPADNLNSSVLGAMGLTLEELGTLGGALAGLAAESQQQLGQLSQAAVGASLGLAQTSTEAALGLAQSTTQGAFDFAAAMAAANVAAAASTPVYAFQKPTSQGVIAPVPFGPAVFSAGSFTGKTVGRSPIRSNSMLQNFSWGGATAAPASTLISSTRAVPWGATAPAPKAPTYDGVHGAMI